MRQNDLVQVIAILRRRAWLIVLCCLVTAGAAFGFSSIQQKEYSTSASLLFRNPGFAEDLFGTSATAVNPSQTREAATNEKLVGLKVVAVRTANRLKGLTAAEVSSMVSVTSEGEAELVSVTATSPVPAQAKRVANEFARQFIAFRAGSDRLKLLQAERLAERELDRLTAAEKAGPRGQALSRGAEKLGILASLQTGNAELVQPAELPTSPSSPEPRRNGILGAVLGLLLGVGLAFLLERLNRRLRDPEEAREAFDLPVLGTVPQSKAIMASNQGAAAPELPFVENEAFRMLRASLSYFSVDHAVRSVLVASHDAEAGKSTVAWNLARVAATSSKVVIVETDLRNPSLARQHGLSVGPGLAELLTHQIGLEEAIQAKPIDIGGNGTGGGGGALDVIVAGVSPPNPADLIASWTMSEVLTDLAERYELVVIDTAPLGVVADAYPLLRQVGGAIVVARMGKTTRDSAERLREQLARLEAPVLGIVANGIKVRRHGKYGYGSYGGYHQAPAEQDRAVVAEISAEPRAPDRRYDQIPAEQDRAVVAEISAEPRAPDRRYDQIPAERDRAVAAEISAEPRAPEGGYHQWEAEQDGALAADAVVPEGSFLQPKLRNSSDAEVEYFRGSVVRPEPTPPVTRRQSRVSPARHRRTASTRLTLARIGESARVSAERLREQLERLEGPVLDSVADRIKSRRDRNYERLAINARPGAPAEQDGAVAADAGAEPEVPAIWNDGPINR